MSTTAMTSSQATVSTEPRWVRWTLIGLVWLLIGVFLLLPLAVLFYEALSLSRVFEGNLPWAKAWQRYVRAITEPGTWAAIKLTLLVAAIAVPLNLFFGVAAAWCITKFNFRGRGVLTTMIDLPFSISPVVAGLTLILLFGQQGWFADWVNRDISIGLFGRTWFTLSTAVVFAVPGIVLATIFITFPFVARELIPLMQSQGTDDEMAARSLGASGWQMFRRVTLPNIRWGLLYGVILCNARAMGEFGAVYVVSANYEGQITLPLQVERLYRESVVSVVPAFAVATLLALLAVVTLIIKALAEWRYSEELKAHSKR